MKKLLLVLFVLSSATIQAQNVGIATNDKDTLFIRSDLFQLISASWDGVRDEPKPVCISVESLSQVKKRISKNKKKLLKLENDIRKYENERRKVEIFDRFINERYNRYFLFF